MKPYGIDNIPASLDVDDIRSLALKGSTGRLAGHSGDFHPYSYGATKARIRRTIKRNARRAGRAACEEV